MERFRNTTLAVLLLLLLPGVLRAEGGSNPAAAPPASQGEAPEKPKLERFKFSAELRWRAEFRDNADFQPADDFDAFLGQRIRVRLLVRADERLSFFVEGQDVWLFGAERDKIIHNLATNLYQAYAEWSPAAGSPWQLRAGRQELIYGKERLVGAFGWDNVGRSFDAARLRYVHAAWTADAFWGRLVEVRRGGAPHRPGNRDLYGVFVARAPKSSPGRTEFYGLFLHDGLRTPGELAAPLETTRIMTLGFRRERAPATGLRYELEHAWQFGERGPDSHRAAALVASTGYAWGGRFRPLFGFEYDFATGDNNPSDGDSREFENLFPTNHLHYGYADLVGLRNLHDFRLSASARPHPRLTVQADYHRFLLAARRGPWKNAGGRVLGFDPTGVSGRDLGQEFDLTVSVPVWERHLFLLGGYSVFLPGRFAIRTRGPETHHFGYLQTSVRF